MVLGSSRMTTSSKHDVTMLLRRWSDGEREALQALLPVIHEELRRIARRYMNKERADHTLETGGLINEAYLRLIEQEHMQWHNRAHFYAIAATTMRRILVDHARQRNSHKRGGGVPDVTLDEALQMNMEQPPDLVALDDALNDLEKQDPQKSRLVELRFFGGLSVDEAAGVLDISPRSAAREWATARAWLREALA